MTDDPFDRLLDAMSEIAEAVNAFASPEVQRRVCATRQWHPCVPRWDGTGAKRCGAAASAHDWAEHGWSASRSDGYRPPAPASLSRRGLRRQNSRQELGAVIPHAGVCAGPPARAVPTAIHFPGGEHRRCGTEPMPYSGLHSSGARWATAQYGHFCDEFRGVK